MVKGEGEGVVRGAVRIVSHEGRMKFFTGYLPHVSHVAIHALVNNELILLCKFVSSNNLDLRTF